MGATNAERHESAAASVSAVHNHFGLHRRGRWWQRRAERPVTGLRLNVLVGGGAPEQVRAVADEHRLRARPHAACADVDPRVHTEGAARLAVERQCPEDAEECECETTLEQPPDERDGEKRLAPRPSATPCRAAPAQAAREEEREHATWEGGCADGRELAGADLVEARDLEGAGEESGERRVYEHLAGQLHAVVASTVKQASVR